MCNLSDLPCKAAGERQGAVTQKEQVGEALLRARRSAGLSQAELGEAAGVDRGYVSDVEQGKKSPTVGWLLYCAAAMDTTVSDILQGVKL